MDKLRSSYKKYQQQIFAQNPRYIAPDKVLRYSKNAQQQIQRMQNAGQYANYEEAIFYKQKFQSLYEISSKYQNKNIGEQNYHKDVKQVMQKDFAGNSRIQSKLRGTANQTQAITPAQTLTPAQNLTPTRSTIQAQTLNSATNSRAKSKSPLKDFFDEQQMKNSKKMTFSNMLSVNDTPLKYGLRSVHRPKKDTVSSQMNDLQLRRLEQQNHKLRSQLQNQKNIQPNDDGRLRELRGQVQLLDEQNRKLRSQASKSSRSDFYVQQQYEPYNLKVRQNNIVKINSKNISQSQRASQFGGASEDFHKQKKGSQIYYDNQQNLLQSQFTHNPNANMSPTRKSNVLLDVQMLNASQSSIQTQLLNLQDSQLYDEQKNQICREKIAFFKKSMVIVKGDDFDIAFKRSDFNSQMDKLRLIIYVNNKDQIKCNCSIEYDFDRQDFEVNIRRKLTSVQASNQGRQQIQVYLKNTVDLGCLITAKVSVGNKMKKIIVPTLFVDFDPEYKYQFQNVGYIERNITAPLLIKPMSQFCSINSANNVLQLHRQYQQNQQVGKLYGKSKACKGMVKLTWTKSNKLKIQTCQEWRTLMGYLFLNAEETIHY